MQLYYFAVVHYGLSVGFNSSICSRREICPSGVLLIGGSLPADVPAREGTPPAGSAG